jgi:hypothetical protein
MTNNNSNHDGRTMIITSKNHDDQQSNNNGATAGGGFWTTMLHRRRGGGPQLHQRPLQRWQNQQQEEQSSLLPTFLVLTPPVPPQSSFNHDDKEAESSGDDDLLSTISSSNSSSGEISSTSTAEEATTTTALVVRSTSTTTVCNKDDDDDNKITTLTKKNKKKKKQPRHRKSSKTKTPQWRQPVDVESYMARREMTKTQERWNALTMLPYPAYCLYFCLSAQWFEPPVEDEVENYYGLLAQRPVVVDDVDRSSSAFFWSWWTTDEHGCLSSSSTSSSSSWHSMPCLPPFPVLAVAVGVSLHAPFSFLYHWQYAHTMPPVERSRHWSRRLDHAFIHICSIFACCGTTDSIEYIVVNGLYNIDCVLQHLVKRDVRPRRNQVRCGLSLLLYTLPLLFREDGGDGILLFCQLWAVFATSIWFFVAYPIGGWSHSVFHLIMALSPPLTLRAAARLADPTVARACHALLMIQQRQQGEPPMMPGLLDQ